MEDKIMINRDSIFVGRAKENVYINGDLHFYKDSIVITYTDVGDFIAYGRFGWVNINDYRKSFVHI